MKLTKKNQNLYLAVRCCPCSRPRFLHLFNRGCGPGLLQSGRPREALCSNHRARLACCCGQGAKGVLLQSQSAQQKKSLQSKATSTKEISPIKSQTNLQRTIKLAAEKKISITSGFPEKSKPKKIKP